MKNKLSIDRIGNRGSIALLIIGILSLVFGIYLQTKANDLPEDAIELTATITSFQTEESAPYQSTATLVTYAVNGRVYQDIPLGQYEASWKIGDTVNICCNSSDPSHIWTRTMQYRGIFFMFFSASFLIVAIYKLLQFRKIKGINEHETDLDDSGQEKFSISSFIIPLAAGLPLTVAGILYLLVEHSFFGLVISLLGAAAVLAGIFSLIDFIRQRIAAKSKTADAS